MGEVMGRPGNPSSPHGPGRYARELLERALAAGQLALVPAPLPALALDPIGVMRPLAPLGAAAEDALPLGRTTAG
mgnify:CR=1 FL=1